MKITAQNLYEKLLRDVATVPLSVMLPEVLQLAREIENGDLYKWARLEYEGYFKTNSALTEDVVVPEYREVVGQHSDEYGNVLLLTDPEMQIVNEYRVRWGVAELERLAKRTGFITMREVHLAKIIKEHLGVEVTRYSIDASSLEHVLSGIRSELGDRFHQMRQGFAMVVASNKKAAPVDVLKPAFLARVREQTLQQALAIITALLVAYVVYLLGWTG